ncbi:MATE family efflux transporter [Halococcus sediminicola]|uniref:MATE family efflux transporter n=1 Tax=Halococcus sediminicola TaxID=1264579 RepID=UPI0009AE7310
MSLVSRFVGVGEIESANSSAKQPLWIALTISVPLTLVTWDFAEGIVGPLADDPERFGRMSIVYIMVISISFRFWSMIDTRVLQGG